MKRKKIDKVLHMMLNGGITNFLSPIGRTSKTMKEMTSVIEAGACEIKNLPDWMITMIAHNGYAIIQVNFGTKTLVSSTYVVWAEQGSDAAWSSAKAAYGEKMKPLLGMIPEAIHMREKPLAPKWIATLIQHIERPLEMIPHAPLLGCIVSNLALCMIEYYGSMETKCSKPNSVSADENPFMTILNDGQKIIACDYFGSDLENTGKYLISCNHGAIRLLWPACRKNTVQEMMQAKEIIVTRGIYMGQEGLEVLFDDHSNVPLSIVMTDSSVIGLFPGDLGDKQWKFTIWMRVNGRPRLVFSRMAYWREGTNLPDCRPLDTTMQDG